MLFNPPHRWIESPRPRSFAGLMEIYEANYMRLRKLNPVSYAVGDHAVSKVCGGLDLHLKVLVRSSYTSTIQLTYYFSDQYGIIRPDPNLQLRIYHDTLQAEVLNYSSCGNSWLARKRSGTAADVQMGKWTANRFLYKWLGYCARQGHGFPNKTAALTAPSRLEVIAE